MPGLAGDARADHPRQRASTTPARTRSGPTGLALAATLRCDAARAATGRRSRRSRSPASRSSSPSAPTSPASRDIPEQAAAQAVASSATGVFAQAARQRACRRSRSSTARRWAAASSSRCTADYRTLSRTAAGARAARGLPRPGPRLGRHLAAAEPDRHRERRQGRSSRTRSTRTTHAQAGAGAFELGIADALLDPADFLERVAALGRRGASPARSTVDAARGRPRRRPGTMRWRRGRALADAEGARRRARRRTGRSTCSRWPRTATWTRGFAAEDEALADLIMGDELRAGLYAFDLVQKRAKRPAGAPDKALARPVTKVGVVGAGLMASQLALLFVRRLEVPVVLTDLDQARVDKGVGYVHGEIDKLLRQGPDRPGRGEPAHGAGHRHDRQGRLRRRRLRDRGGVRGARGQEAGLRRGRGRSSGRLRAGDQHLVAVGHRDGRRARSTRSGSSASTSSTRSR